MGLKKYVMVVDSDDGPLSELVPELWALDFRVMLVPDALRAAEMLSDFPKLGVVAVNENVSPRDTRRILEVLRRRHPEVAILWRGSADRLEARPSEILLPDDPKAAELLHFAESVLAMDSYPEELVEVLTHAANDALAAFGAHSAAREPFLKATHTRMAELNALLQWSGPHSVGHLIVGCSRMAGTDAHQRLFHHDEPVSDSCLADLIGEVGNRILGRLAQFLGYQGGIRFGLPLFLEGESGSLRNDRCRSSLALEFEGLAGPFFVEFSGDAKQWRSGDTSPTEPIKPGQFILL